MNTHFIVSRCLRVTAAAVLFALAACSTPSGPSEAAFRIDPATAVTLNIYRPDNGQVGKAVTYYAYLDGVRIAHLSSEEAHTVQVPPGEHELYIQSQFIGMTGTKDPKLEVNFRPATEYFARFSIELGGISVIGTAVSASPHRSLVLVDRDSWIERR